MIFQRIRPLGLLLGLLATLLIFGCRQHSDSDDVQVRLINAVPDSGALSVSAEGKPLLEPIPFRSSTGYRSVSAGTFRVSVASDVSGKTLAVRDGLSFQKGHRYTALALGNGQTSLQIMEDEGTGGYPAGKAGIKLIQAAPYNGPVDLVVNSIVGLKSIGYGQRSETLLLDPGDYDLEVVTFNTPNVLAGPIHLHLGAGHAYTLVSMGLVAQNNLSLEAYSDTP